MTNLLCEQAMIGAYADRQAVVSPQNVRRAAAEFDLEGAPFGVERPHVVSRETCATPGPDPAVWLREVPPPEIPVPADQIVEVAAPSIWEPAREPAFEVPGRIAAPVSVVPHNLNAGSSPMLNEKSPLLDRRTNPRPGIFGSCGGGCDAGPVAPIVAQPEMVQARDASGSRWRATASPEHEGMLRALLRMAEASRPQSIQFTGATSLTRLFAIGGNSCIAVPANGDLSESRCHQDRFHSPNGHRANSQLAD